MVGSLLRHATGKESGTVIAQVTAISRTVGSGAEQIVQAAAFLDSRLAATNAADD